MAKIKLEDIKDELAADGWLVISDKYENLKSEMTFECPYGHRVFLPWEKLRSKRECPSCKAQSTIKVDNEVLPKSKGVKRTLALDQASKVTGYAVYDNNKLIKYGTFTTSGADEVERFAMVRAWLLSMIRSWKPDYVGIEGIQFQEEGGGQKMGITVFQTLARLQGILMLTCHEEDVPYEVCSTNTWRHTCGVKGKSRTDKKRSMQLLVEQWHKIKVSEDEADAIGIGYHLVNFIQKNTEVTNWEI